MAAGDLIRNAGLIDDHQRSPKRTLGKLWERPETAAQIQTPVGLSVLTSDLIRKLAAAVPAEKISSSRLTLRRK